MKSVEEFLKQYKNIEKTNTYEIENNNCPIEEFDKAKTKILKYILYKKRSEAEVRRKFSSFIEENLLEDVIESLKQNNYINDENYIERAVSEYLSISLFSMKEIRNKLYAKGVQKDVIDAYFFNNRDQLESYEIKSAKKIIIKKQNQMDKVQIEQFLYKKGYKSSSVKCAFEEI